MSRLKDKYTNEVSSALMSKFEYKSVMQIPKVVKLRLNIFLLGGSCVYLPSHFTISRLLHLFFLQHELFCHL